MWGIYHRQFIKNGKPYWLYKLVGDEESLSEIYSSQLGVSKDDNGFYYYGLKKFHGPVTEIIKKSSGLKVMYVPVYCNSFPVHFERRYLDMNYTLDFRVKGWHAETRLSSKEEYSDSWYVNIISEGLSPSDRLEVVLNSLINFRAQSQFVSLPFIINGKEFNVSAEHLLDLILNEQNAEDGRVDFSGFVGNKEPIFFRYGIDNENFELYPYNRKNVWCSIEKEDEMGVVLNGVYAPDYLCRYIDHEYYSYSADIGFHHKDTDIFDNPDY